MRPMMAIALAAGLAVTACSDPAGPAVATVADDAVFAAGMSASVGGLGDYLGPALSGVRARDGDSAAGGRCAELEQLRRRLQERIRDGDEDGAEQARLRLRLAAAALIRAGLGEAPLDELLAEGEQYLEQLRNQVRQRAALHADTAAAQQRLRAAEALQQRASLARQDGRCEEALELAARVREQARAQQVGTGGQQRGGAGGGSGQGGR